MDPSPTTVVHHTVPMGDARDRARSGRHHDAHRGRDRRTRSSARIRAFFVHPAWASRGLARRLFSHCENAARRAGFRGFELPATLPGEPLQVALGFTALEAVTVELLDGVSVPCVRMARPIGPPVGTPDGGTPPASA
ncbi:MAG: GNAT family N-acetyltransferase [Gemmatimonadaceae bacterium]